MNYFSFHQSTRPSLYTISANLIFPIPRISNVQRLVLPQCIRAMKIIKSVLLRIDGTCQECKSTGGVCGYDVGIPVCCKRNSSSKIKCNQMLPSGSIAIGLLLFMAFSSGFGKKKSTHHRKYQNLGTLVQLKQYSYAEVKKITKSFSYTVGKGGFGTVYGGNLRDGRKVAVKNMKDFKSNGEDFINEVASMSQTSHVNIVSLLGFCVARGVEYLHHGCRTRIVHFDIKPQNVLLDDNLCPKVSDFGLAKLCEKRESILSFLDTRGTIGYIAPEVFSRLYGPVSYKSDVYSYGMLVLEMIGARNKETEENVASNTSSAYFPDWIYKDLENGEHTC
ncbi:unnamed protein product, partial [Brassica oleracea]